MSAKVNKSSKKSNGDVSSKETHNGAISEKTIPNGDLLKNHNHSKEKKDSTEEMVNELLFQKLTESVKTLQERMKKDMDNKLEAMVEQLLEEVKRLNFQNNDFKSLFVAETETILKNRRVSPERNKLPDKEFLARNSLLTDLLEVKHIKTIYNIFVVIMFLTFMNTVVHDLVVDGTINLGLRPIYVSFGKFHVALGIWLCMQTTVTLAYYAFKLWAQVRLDTSKSKIITKLWDFICLTGFIGYQVAFYVVFTKLVLHFDLPHSSSLCVLLEMTRFTMKIHAFVRSNAPKVLRFKEKSDDEKLLVQLPSMKTFQYFLFAPTLVYRDQYPRTREIRWGKVVNYFLEVLMIILFLSFIFERFAGPYFGQFGQTEISMSALVLSIFGCMIPAITIFVCGFYVLLHVWLNGWAEMLRFADRMFYQDWWNATSFDVYYRKWNVVVHDWLYTYVYKDLHEYLFSKYKTMAALTVFTISATIHEYILAFAFRFFYPVMFVLFEGFGVFMMFITKKNRKSFGNIVLWGALCIGNGIQLALYTMEYFARQNCQVGDSFVDYLIPVSWTCNRISINPDWKIKFSF